MLSAEVSKILELHIYLVLDEVVVEKGGVIYPPLPDYLTQGKVDRIRVDMIGQNGLIEASLFYKIHCPAGIYMLNDVVLVSLLVTLNIFHTLLYCFYC